MRGVYWCDNYINTITSSTWSIITNSTVSVEPCHSRGSVTMVVKCHGLNSIIHIKRGGGLKWFLSLIFSLRWRCLHVLLYWLKFLVVKNNLTEACSLFPTAVWLASFCFIKHCSCCSQLKVQVHRGCGMYLQFIWYDASVVVIICEHRLPTGTAQSVQNTTLETAAG